MQHRHRLDLGVGLREAAISIGREGTCERDRQELSID